VETVETLVLAMVGRCPGMNGPRRICRKGVFTCCLRGKEWRKHNRGRRQADHNKNPNKETWLQKTKMFEQRGRSGSRGREESHTTMRRGGSLIQNQTLHRDGRQVINCKREILPKGAGKLGKVIPC